MTLGQKLKTARLEAGLSQRELAGETITRNMLSQIENGTARPSMDTLQYLSRRLGKSISYFLEEHPAVSPNHGAVLRAREAFDRGQWLQTVEALAEFREPDEIFDRERWLLLQLSLLRAGRQALEECRNPYAMELLERAEEARRRSAYTFPELERQHLLLLARAGAAVILPPLDEELLLRSRLAVEQGQGDRAGRLLDAAQDRSCAQWHYLRGRAHQLQGQYGSAAECYRRAEADYADAIPRLEACYRELGDYKMAYLYACKHR